MDDNWLKVGHYSPGFVAGVQSEIETLRQLDPDWDGYGARPIDPAVIDAAKSFIARLPENLAYRPHVAPLSNGTLQLEWHEGSRSLELEFESPRSIRYLQWHPEQDIEEEASFPARDIETAVDLIQWFMAGAYQ